MSYYDKKNTFGIEKSPGRKLVLCKNQETVSKQVGGEQSAFINKLIQPFVLVV